MTQTLRQALAAARPAARRRARLDPAPYAFVAPILLLLLAITFYPALYAVWLAMTDACTYAVLRGRFALEHSFFITPRVLAGAKDMLTNRATAPAVSKVKGESESRPKAKAKLT